MWRIIIQCSAESWRNHAKDFEAIASQYPATPLSSKKMKDDERRLLEYRVENVGDAEDLVEACAALPGFSATFESL